MRIGRPFIAGLAVAIGLGLPTSAEELVVASVPGAPISPRTEPVLSAIEPMPAAGLEGEPTQLRPRRPQKPHRRLVLPRLSPIISTGDGAGDVVPPVAPQRPRQTLTVTLAGDLGLGGNMQPVRGEGALKHGALIHWRDLTERIKPLLDGDLNFANLETAVTERNDLRPEPKSFNFRSHPDGVRHLVGLGLNLLSTANNHSMDFGVQGAFETVAHLDRLQGLGLKAHAGLGRNRDEAGRAHIVEAGDNKVAFSSIGIVTGGFPLHRAGDSRPGQMAYQSPDDFMEVTRRLAEAGAAYRILSVHQGIEGQVQADATAIRKLRHEAVLGRGIDLVAGHHAHVVQGIETVAGKLIFYGLGNFLHPGMQNMSSFGACRDYGLFARVHLASDETGHLRARAVEVIPLTDMHYKAQRMAPGAAAERIGMLNYLAGGLDDPATGARGLRFAVQADGSGLYCAPGAESDPGRSGRLCAGWQGPTELGAAQRSRAQGACGPIAGAQVARSRSFPVEAAAPSPRLRRTAATPIMLGGN